MHSKHDETHWITEGRDNLGWSQGKLAQTSGIAQSMISRYERGRAIPSQPHQDAIADALGIDNSSIARSADRVRWSLQAQRRGDGGCPLCQTANPVNIATEEASQPHEEEPRSTPPTTTNPELGAGRTG